MRISKERLQKIVSRMGGHRIIVLGDVMLDEYISGVVNRISPEAPVPIVQVDNFDYRLGGAANVALNLKVLGDDPILIGVCGEDNRAFELKKLMKRRGLQVDGIITDRNRPTTTKTRVLAHNHQMVRIDREETEEISLEITDKILRRINTYVNIAKAIIISDYGKGVITKDLVQEVIDLALEKNLFIAVDPKDTHFLNYKKVSVITPNHHEAGFVTGRRIVNDKVLQEVGWNLLKSLNCESLVITRGERGMSLFEKDGDLTHIPTVARNVYDVTGAGDTVISTLVSSVCAGAKLKEAAWISNQAAGMVIQEIGTAQVKKQELNEEINGTKIKFRGRIVTKTQLLGILKKSRQQDKKIVFTNGCFDLIHIGHLKFLAKAKKMGDVLVVGLNSDSSVRRLKGEGRPILSQKERSEILTGLESVDFVTIFSENTPMNLIKHVKPDILVKGGDYKVDNIVGAEFVQSYGGKVRTIPLVKNKSTKSIISSILRRYGKT
jgi:D-beta-D-heptose 7-phosphate kinase/D-beta-D-heptose 1-phosphate adenosyltransferase